MAKRTGAGIPKLPMAGMDRQCESPTLTTIMGANCDKVANTVERKEKLISFLSNVVPAELPRPKDGDTRLTGIKTRDDFLADVVEGMKVAPMSVRLTPHILSVANWDDPLGDPIRRQFIPLKSTMVPDHPKLTLDSLHETDDSPVQGLVHCYPEKVLFLGEYT